MSRNCYISMNKSLRMCERLCKFAAGVCGEKRAFCLTFYLLRCKITVYTIPRKRRSGQRMYWWAKERVAAARPFSKRRAACCKRPCRRHCVLPPRSVGENGHSAPQPPPGTARYSRQRVTRPPFYGPRNSGGTMGIYAHPVVILRDELFLFCGGCPQTAAPENRQGRI